ncbi:hypothetical protein [Demequina sp. SO4-18]|uniref:hypothetical protein n=1 Tax=Demequina sp. SO4-18 TaxID=3401026 RepID=UPI003B5BE0DC
MHRNADEPTWEVPTEALLDDIAIENTVFYVETTWLASTEVTTGHDTDGGVPLPLHPREHPHMTASLQRVTGQRRPPLPLTAAG